MTLGFALVAGVAAAAGRTGEVSIRDVLPLEAAQRARLATLVRDDPEAAALFARKQAAVAALPEKPPQPLAVIHYEGIVSNEPRRLATVERLQELDDAAAMFEAWQVTGDEALARRVRATVSAWAAVYVPTGNDVNEDKLLPLMVAYAALRDAFGPGERQAVDTWLRTILARQAEAQARERPNAQLTNRHTKRLRLLAIAELALGDHASLRGRWQDVRNFIARALQPDGTSYDFHYRDTLTYHASTLLPLVDLAALARAGGEDLYGWQAPGGSSLRRSVDFLVPFADGRATREEWVNSKVELDRRRAAAGLADYQPGRQYDPARAVPLLEAASLFEPAHVARVAKLVRSEARRFPTWRCVVNAAIRP